LLEFLKERNGGSATWGITDAHPAFAKWYSGQIADNCRSMAGRETRKYGIEKRGLCLLISYTAEIIQTNRIPLALTDLGHD
jgi:hypothetical protein